MASQSDLLISQLRERLEYPDSLLFDQNSLTQHSHDATTEHQLPWAVLVAQSVNDTVAAVQFCFAHKIPITPRGAGTGLSGGAVPSINALVLSTTQLTKLEIDQEQQICFCGPGVITKQLQDEAVKYNLTYPPDPASYAESTIGGNVAEGAGGLRCRRFGVTKDYVRGLLAVTADGQLLKTGSYNQNAGFSVADVLISSEGTLAIIVEICIELIPVPARGTTILAAFPTAEGAAKTVAEINSAGIIPTVMEFLDGAAARASNKYEQTEGLDKSEAILLFETGIGVANQEQCISDICKKHHAYYVRSESDPIKSEELWKIRRNLSKAVRASAKAWLSEDVAVPNTHFAELVAFTAALNDNSPVRVLSFGHAGDGNLHAVFLADDDSPATHQEIDRKVAILMKETLRLDGTLTGEHGIGLAKRAFLSQEFDLPTLSSMKTIKLLFDPSLILNPDKIFDDIRE